MSQGTMLIILAGAGVLLMVLGLAFFIRPRWLVSWLKGTFALTLIIAGGYAAALALDLRHYETLGSLKTIASVGITRTGKQAWQVRLEQDEKEPRNVTIKGDQWQVDARIIRFAGPLSWLGVKPAYRLERIGGRYLSLEQARNSERTVYDLDDDTVFDSWKLDQKYGLPFVEAVYGNATFMPLEDGAVFDIRLSSTGLVSVPANQAARRAMNAWFPEGNHESE